MDTGPGILGDTQGGAQRQVSEHALDPQRRGTGGLLHGA